VIKLQEILNKIIKPAYNKGFLVKDLYLLNLICQHFGQKQIHLNGIRADPGIHCFWVSQEALVELRTFKVPAFGALHGESWLVRPIAALLAIEVDRNPRQFVRSLPP
jgi:hypothetical protein